MNDFTIYIPKRIYQDDDVTGDELLVYAELQYQARTCHPNTGKIPICCQNIVYSLYGTYEPPKGTASRITTDLNRLIDNKIVVGEKLANGRYLIEPLTHKNETFAVMPYRSLLAIMESDYKKKGALFRMLCWVLGSINNKTKTGNCTYKYFANVLNVSTVTVSSYMNLLEELKLISIDRRTVGQVGKPHTYCQYTRPGDDKRSRAMEHAKEVFGEEEEAA